jgi:uncharacterized protein (TIGR04255 family)
LECAPIVEALIEIKLAEPLQQDSLHFLRNCASGFADHYPLREDLMLQQFQFQAGAASQMPGAAIQMGFLCKDATPHRVVHLKLDGFGLSELRPYSSWNEFFPEARRLWTAYRQAVGGVPTGSWSIRYINQISWPEDERMDDYLYVHPTVPDNMPQSLTGCFMRLQSALAEPSEGLFTQQIFQVMSSEVGKVSFIVDHTFMFSSIGLSDSELWHRIQLAQLVKNKYFLSTFTPRALEMFQ